MAAFLPGVSMGDQGIGVLVALPLILVLTVFVSRASLGTLEQRMADVDKERRKVSSWRSRVKQLTYSSETWIGRQPARATVLVVIVTVVAGVGLLLWAGVSPGDAAALTIATLVLHCGAAGLWASRYREVDAFFRRSSTCGVLIFLPACALLYTVVSGPAAPISVGMVIAPAVFYLPRWGHKQVLAATGQPRLDALYAELDASYAQLQQALRDRDAAAAPKAQNGPFALLMRVGRTRP